VREASGIVMRTTALHRTICGALALVLAVVPLGPAVAAPTTAAAPAEVVRASLTIDASALGDAGVGVTERIRVRGEALLRKHDVLAGRDASDPVIAIAVEPLGTEPGYRCRFAVKRGDVVIGDTEGTSLCNLCTLDELVEHVEAAIERVVPQVPAVARVEPAPPVEPVARPGKRRAGATPSGRTPELRALGRAGIATAIGGSVVLGVGVGLAARGSSLDDPPRGPRIAGIAIASVSVALLVAGFTMLAVDLRRGRADAGASTRAHARRRPVAFHLGSSGLGARF
jgi:hypothetical protein